MKPEEAYKSFDRIKNPKFYDQFQTVGWNPDFENDIENIQVPDLKDIYRNSEFDSNLLKIEYLITRECCLNCAYCTMPTPVMRRPELSKEGKKLIAHCMKVLKIPFTALYGSEPLMLSIDELGETIREIETCGTFATIITSGIGLTQEKLETLNQRYKLQSLTMSCDDLNPKLIADPATAKKSDRTFKFAPFWQKNFVEKGLARDTQITITVHRKNIEQLEKFTKYWSDLGVYVSIDWLHVWRGQEGSKVSDDSNAEGYMFKAEDREIVDKALRGVIKLKESGAKIWNSVESLEMYAQQSPDDYSWRCSPTAFLTVDCDGSVWFCDDYQPRSKGQHLYLWDILTPENLDKMRKRNIEWMDFKSHTDACSGCRWATHIEAERVIHQKTVDVNHYVHGK